MTIKKSLLFLMGHALLCSTNVRPENAAPAQHESTGESKPITSYVSDQQKQADQAHKEQSVFTAGDSTGQELTGSIQPDMTETPETPVTISLPDASDTSALVSSQLDSTKSSDSISELTHEVTKAQDKINEIDTVWQEYWKKRAPGEPPSAVLLKVTSKLELKKRAEALAFEPFEVSKLADPNQKIAELNEQYTALKSLDAALANMVDELMSTYEDVPQASFTTDQKQEMLDAAATISYISNVRTGILAEQRKVFDGITQITLWQKSTFKNALAGVDLQKLSFNTRDLVATTNFLKNLTDNFQSLSTTDKVSKMTDPDLLETEVAVLSDTVKELEKLKKELETLEDKDESFKQAKEELNALLKAAQAARVKIEAQNIAVQMRTFASRVDALSTYLRNVIASFFSVVSSSVGIVRAVQFTNAGYGAEDAAQSRAAEELFASGASKERRQQAYKELQDLSAQIDKSMNFAKRLLPTLQDSTTIPSEEQKRALIQLRTTLVDYITNMQQLGTMIGVQIESPRDSLGATLIGFVKKFYTPALLDSEQANFWLLPRLAEQTALFAGSVDQLNTQTKTAQELLKTLDTQIFKSTSTATSALYTISVVSEILARISGVGAIGVTVGLGLFSALVGVDLPFQTILDWSPVILISGAALLYVIHYATYQAALKMSGAITA